jgi:hypothetical protein
MRNESMDGSIAPDELRVRCGMPAIREEKLG